MQRNIFHSALWGAPACRFGNLLSTANNYIGRRVICFQLHDAQMHKVQYNFLWIEMQNTRAHTIILADKSFAGEVFNSSTTFTMHHVNNIFFLQLNKKIQIHPLTENSKLLLCDVMKQKLLTIWWHDAKDIVIAKVWRILCAVTKLLARLLQAQTIMFSI